MIGKKLLHYEVTGRIGAGGMGEVYRATDTKLGREVAIKVLPPGVAKSGERLARLEREARALAALNHPAIGAIYGIEEIEGTRFLVLELVPGETLAERLLRGPLPVGEALAVAAQIAEALSAAHEKRILHRDLKPSNVHLTPAGKVKLLDFGLAKAMREGPGSESPTETLPTTGEGVVVGTAAYMSPEQARGRELDARADIWSFGCVLFEILAGVRTFGGETTPDTLAAVLEREPDWDALPESTPEPVRSLLERCLRKDPSRRLRDVADARIELEIAAEARPLGRRPRHLTRRGALLAGASLFAAALAAVGYRVATSRPTRAIRSVAVLPLQNLSGDPGEEYLADGMTEALISQLGGIRRLRVISRTSVMNYKEAPKPVPEIAAELDVEAVVEGSTQRSGDRVQVSARLIDASNETRLWARTYERDFVDVLTLQSEVAGAIARELRVELAPGERERLTAARRADPEAYDTYLRGRYQLSRFSPQSLSRAVELFEAATELDPGLALAFAGLARGYTLLGDTYILPPREAFAKAKSAALEAIALDPELAEAHASLGISVRCADWDWARAESSYRRAIELNDSDADAHEFRGFDLVLSGSSEEGLRELRAAARLDPLSLQRRGTLAAALYFARRHDESVREIGRLLELAPDVPHAHWILGANYLAMGRHAEAVVAEERAVELSGRLPVYVAFLALSYASVGEETRARELLQELLRAREETYVDPTAIAVVHIGLEQWDDALSWGERAFEERSPGWLYARVGPFLDPLRGRPRFEALLRRMRFPE